MTGRGRIRRNGTCIIGAGQGVFPGTQETSALFYVHNIFAQFAIPDAGVRALAPPGLERPELPSSIRYCHNPRPMVAGRVLDSVRLGRSPGRNFTSGISDTPDGATAGRGIFGDRQIIGNAIVPPLLYGE